MAKIIRTIIEDKLEFYDTAGVLIKEIPYRINITSVSATVQRQRQALQEAAANSTGSLEEIGACFMRLLSVVFGEETAKQIMAVYDEQESPDYAAMVNDITPVLVNDIFPAFDAARLRAVEAKKATKRKWAALKRV